MKPAVSALGSLALFITEHPWTFFVIGEVTILCIAVGLMRAIGVRMPFDGPADETMRDLQLKPIDRTKGAA